MLLVVKYKRMRSVSHTIRMREGQVHAGFQWENLRERDRFEDLGVDGRIIIKWILRNRMGRCGHGNEDSGCIKCLLTS